MNCAKADNTSGKRAARTKGDYLRTRPFVVASSYFPPLVGGTSTVMSNLLQRFDPEKFAVISEDPSFFPGETHNRANRLSCPITRMTVPAMLRKMPFSACWLPVYRAASIPRIQRSISMEIRRLKAERVIAVYPSLHFCIAALKAAKLHRLPLATYFMDEPRADPKSAVISKSLHRVWLPRITKTSCIRLVISEGVADYISSKWGLSSTIIPHLANFRALAKRSKMVQRKDSATKFLIVHTGTLSSYQGEGVKRLIRIVQSRMVDGWKLAVTAPSIPRDIREIASSSKNVSVMTTSDEEVLHLQSEASVLVAFGKHGKHNTGTRFHSTEFPTKLLEYMASGNPILIQTGGESFVAYHAKKNGYAVVVEDESLERLESALVRISHEKETRERLIRAASVILSGEFAADSVTRRFGAAVGIFP